MTDREIIEGLIARDNRVTERFFFVQCRPLFCSIIRRVFDYEVEYNELVNELYLYLMADDARKLRDFQYRSSVYQWLKVTAVRFFLKKRKVIENRDQEALYEGQECQTDATGDATADLQRLFAQMPNKRYVYIIQRLVLDDIEPEKLAAEMHITVANLYNIKRRAMAQLTKVALKDKREYEKQ